MTRTQLTVALVVAVLALLVAFLLGQAAGDGDTTVNIPEAPYDCDRELDEDSSVAEVARRNANC